MKKEEKTGEYKTRIYRMQYRILKEKRRNLIVSRILLISFYMFLYIETLEVLNSVPKYSDKLFPLINKVVETFQENVSFKRLARFLEVDIGKLTLIL